MQEKVANQEPDAEEKIEQLTQYSMLEQYDGDVGFSTKGVLLTTVISIVTLSLFAVLVEL